jgi:ATP-dependent DNA helicase RecG
MEDMPGNRVLQLDTPVQYIRGIGPRRSEILAAHGIRSVADLLEYPPFRYEDRTEFRAIASLSDGEWVLIRGRVCSVGGYEGRVRRLSIVEVLVKDATAGIMLKFFNQPYMKQALSSGQTLVIYGQVKRDEYGQHSLVLINPECEAVDDGAALSVHSGRVVPIYRRIGDLRTRALRQIMHSVVAGLPPSIAAALPTYVEKQYRLMPRGAALCQLHFPVLRGTDAADRAAEMDLLNGGLSPAHKRLIFEELFQFQAGIRMIRESRAEVKKNRTVELGNREREAIKRVLPFHPTRAQKRVLGEIALDMRSPRPMSRLLQGDVGSGKTIVAAQAAIIAVENGFQVAIMAPTEILAEQHYFNFRRLLTPLGYPIGLVKGSLAAKQKRLTLDGIRSGEIRVAIGTHALIQEGVEFRNLALAVIDEQHRFGVVQRNILREKAVHPDMLVMTATPIPRSLALTLYGDLEVSVIDELPPGRKPVLTKWLNDKQRPEAYEAIRRTVLAGQQVYVVYPLVEESERSDLRAATEMALHLQRRIFPDFKIGLLHGKMKSADKDAVMTAFAGGEIQVLVATTVIEVGVDVANASLMVIEHAERFGLAQLHQLRGRVGRGAAQSQCILVGDAQGSVDARRRLEIMCDTNDGFRIAEVDLELRGPGEVAGTRQSGLPTFKYANLVRDRKALELARTEADRFWQRLRSTPDEEGRSTAALIRRIWAERYGLALVG